jgi:hypothetical protein
LKKVTPQEKKKLEYEKGRRAGSHHGFTQKYSEIKPRTNRVLRKKSKLFLKDVQSRPEIEIVQIVDEKAVTVKHLDDSILKDFQFSRSSQSRPASQPLKEWVETQAKNRIRRIAARYFSKPYDTDLHRLPFSRFLQTITAEDSEFSTRIAEFFNAILHPSTGPLGQIAYRYERQREWLSAFFQDEPEWQAGLKNWIIKFR